MAKDDTGQKAEPPEHSPGISDLLSSSRWEEQLAQARARREKVLAERRAARNGDQTSRPKPWENEPEVEAVQGIDERELKPGAAAKPRRVKRASSSVGARRPIAKSGMSRSEQIIRSSGAKGSRPSPSPPTAQKPPQPAAGPEEPKEISLKAFDFILEDEPTIEYPKAPPPPLAPKTPIHSEDRLPKTANPVVAASQQDTGRNKRYALLAIGMFVVGTVLGTGLSWQLSRGDGTATAVADQPNPSAEPAIATPRDVAASPAIASENKPTVTSLVAAQNAPNLLNTGTPELFPMPPAYRPIRSVVAPVAVALPDASPLPETVALAAGPVPPALQGPTVRPIPAGPARERMIDRLDLQVAALAVPEISPLESGVQVDAPVVSGAPVEGVAPTFEAVGFAAARVAKNPPAMVLTRATLDRHPLNSSDAPLNPTAANALEPLAFSSLDFGPGPAAVNGNWSSDVTQRVALARLDGGSLPASPIVAEADPTVPTYGVGPLMLDKVIPTIAAVAAPAAWPDGAPVLNPDAGKLMAAAPLRDQVWSPIGRANVALLDRAPWVPVPTAREDAAPTRISQEFASLDRGGVPVRPGLQAEPTGPIVPRPLERVSVIGGIRATANPTVRERAAQTYASLAGRPTFGQGPERIFTASLPDQTATQLAPLPALIVRPRFDSARVVIHAPSAIADGEVDAIVESIGTSGVPSPNVKRVDLKITKSNVRYFHGADADAARAVAEATNATLRDFTDYSPSPPRGTIEVWLAGTGNSIVATKPKGKTKTTAKKTRRTASTKRQGPSAKQQRLRAVQQRIIQRIRRGDAF